jgi:hypothetical protein
MPMAASTKYFTVKMLHFLPPFISYVRQGFRIEMTGWLINANDNHPS